MAAFLGGCGATDPSASPRLAPTNPVSSIEAARVPDVDMTPAEDFDRKANRGRVAGRNYRHQMWSELAESAEALRARRPTARIYALTVIRRLDPDQGTVREQGDQALRDIVKRASVETEARGLSHFELRLVRNTILSTWRAYSGPTRATPATRSGRQNLKEFTFTTTLFAPSGAPTGAHGDALFSVDDDPEAIARSLLRETVESGSTGRPDRVLGSADWDIDALACRAEVSVTDNRIKVTVRQPRDVAARAPDNPNRILRYAVRRAALNAAPAWRGAGLRLPDATLHTHGTIPVRRRDGALVAQATFTFVRDVHKGPRAYEIARAKPLECGRR